jgi:hypothetical protein
VRAFVPSPPTHERARPGRADGVVVFASTDVAPSGSERFECRAARALARHTTVLFVAGPGGERATPLLRNLRHALFRSVERDPCGAFVLRPACLPEGQRSALQLSGAYLARQLEPVLARLRIVTPAALIAHPRAAYALEREEWASSVYAPNARELRRALPPAHLAEADRSLRGRADLVLELAAMPFADDGIATARPELPRRLLEQIRDLARPFVTPCVELDDPALDRDALVRIAERLERGTLLVPAGRGALVERLDEAQRVATVASTATDLLHVADVALAPLRRDVAFGPAEPEGLFDALASGLPVAASRAAHATALGELVRLFGDTADAITCLRAAGQERDDALRARRRRAAADLRWRVLEGDLVDALRLEPERPSVRPGRMTGWTVAAS